MNTKYTLLMCFFWGFAFTVASSQDAKNETFWVGVTLKEIKERPIRSAWTKTMTGEPYRYCIKDGMMMMSFHPTPVFGVLVRGDKCYIFDVDNLPDNVGNISLRHGDKIFRYRERAELETLKLPIYEGDEAVAFILASDSASRKK